jgi:REP element-mobilizing transposase RayT
MVVMPNHIHGILWIDDDLVGGGCGGGCRDAIGDGRDAINRVSTVTTEKFEKTKKSGGITGKNNPMFYDNISRVLRWYKGRCTFEINKLVEKQSIAETRLIASLPNFAWQPRFHDRIIRDENELNRIREYIIKNPEMWHRDRNNGDLWL